MCKPRPIAGLKPGDGPLWPLLLLCRFWGCAPEV